MQCHYFIASNVSKKTTKNLTVSTTSAGSQEQARPVLEGVVHYGTVFSDSHAVKRTSSLTLVARRNER